MSDGGPLIATQRVTLRGPIEPAGYWLVSEWYRIATLTRPNRLQRLAVRWLLGWGWRAGPL